MSNSLGSRLKHAWNAFTSRDPTYEHSYSGQVSYYRPDRTRRTITNEKSIITAVLNRIALDAAAVEIRHSRLDENGRFSEEINSGLNNCLSLSANIDQTGRAFLQDAYMSLLDEGCVALVPVDTSIDPRYSSSYDIETIRR